MGLLVGVNVPKIIFETDSQYNGHIKVVDFGTIRRIIVDNIVQSISYTAQSCARLYWGKVVELMKKEQPAPQNILILGLGGGTLVQLLSRSFPGVKITSVEIDQVMCDIAKQYFDLDSVANHRVLIEDALRVVIQPQQYGINEYEFDTIIVDIYNGEKFPELGSSGNFISALKNLLTPGGLIIFNRIYVQHHQDDVNIFIDYVSGFFRSVKNLVVAGYTNSDNVLIYGRS